MIRIILLFVATLGATLTSFRHFINGGWSPDSLSSTSQILFFIMMILGLLASGYEFRKYFYEREKDTNH
ncbi:hypothetical protein ACUXCC_005422 [Cytobacillus horneckiae]|uniref:hypothetical protein n=1 Tax=Cytobacillus horneckiae TaxID=549687 RepID=UPI001562043E|nr:hypothetical protein [Cytobacillus horneckiae]MBN6887439.1 hypothetical protein [Cytobacillus horneckiae]NRG44846.1 hypothetical protein [Bacillus sp. CRN 9]